MSHPNAFLGPRGRLALAKCVVEDGWPSRRAAERFQVSVATAARWAGRYSRPRPILCPAVEVLEYGVPVPEVLGKVPPWRPGSELPCSPLHD